MYSKKLLIIPKIAALYFKTNFEVYSAVGAVNLKIGFIYFADR
jgi:hypothetical protein